LSHRILVVEDDPHIREVICIALANAGMSVLEAADGADALRQIDADSFDLVVLDIGLPEIDGLEVCRRIRKTSDLPLLFVSSRSEEIDRVIGLELGGDDYVVKPFSPRELVARVGAIVKRARPAEPVTAEAGETLRIGPLLLDAPRFRAAFEDRDAPLTPIEFTILRALATRPGVVLNRNRIVAAAYARNVNVSDRTIDSHIRNIRAKFAAIGCDDIVETVHGVGFRLGSLGGAAP
jgi:two-component system, OmpR family, response regulator